ncbi:MAG: hypothetical protein IKQ33_01445 [Clostridia bacterium]|nr:hypothetical protein [Clostridia bacterium]
MKEEKQLVLFFSRGTEVDSTNLAAKLKNKFDELGDPAVIPFNPNNPNQPLIIFNHGLINLTVGISDISFIYNSENHKKYYDTVMDIIECFEDLDYSFERLGYISTLIHTKKEKEKFIENVFKDTSMVSSEFQFSWYTKELIDSVSVNVWEREMTDIMNNIELVSVFDINTPMNEVYNISSEFVRDFIKQCDKYIDSKDKKYKK